MEYFWYVIAAAGAGVGTGLAGLSAATTAEAVTKKGYDTVTVPCASALFIGLILLL